MSTMKADLIQNRLGVNSPGVTKGDFVRAWARYGFSAQNAVPVFHLAFNFSAIVDQGQGQGAVNITSPFTVSYPAVVGSCSPMTSWTNRNDAFNATSASQLTWSYVENGGVYDPGLMSLCAFGAMA